MGIITFLHYNLHKRNFALKTERKIRPKGVKLVLLHSTHGMKIQLLNYSLQMLYLKLLVIYFCENFISGVLLKIHHTMQIYKKRPTF